MTLRLDPGEQSGTIEVANSPCRTVQEDFPFVIGATVPPVRPVRPSMHCIGRVMLFSLLAAAAVAIVAVTVAAAR